MHYYNIVDLQYSSWSHWSNSRVTPEQDLVKYRNRMIMKSKWNCPKCEMSSSRHYNVERHTLRIHNGIGEPMNYSAMQYYRERDRHNFRFPSDHFNHVSLSPLTQKEKSHKNFSALLEDQFLQPLSKIVEIRNLLSQFH